MERECACLTSATANCGEIGGTGKMREERAHEERRGKLHLLNINMLSEREGREKRRGERGKRGEDNGVNAGRQAEVLLGVNNKHTHLLTLSMN